MRVVSLVPSLTHAVATLGRAGELVGVTDYCVRGAPKHAARVGGTKFPSLDAVRELHPDLVLANREENRQEDVEALRADGYDVLVTFPRTVPDVAALLRNLGAALDAPTMAERLAADVADAVCWAAQRRPSPPVQAVTLVWRRPWMAVGADTYVSDLLGRCGFANAVADLPGRYPRLDRGHGLDPDVVLLPSEPYAFAERDLAPVADLLGPVPHRFVDGQLLTWHGPHTGAAVRTFTSLATGCAGGHRPPVAGARLPADAGTSAQSRHAQEAR